MKKLSISFGTLIAVITLTTAWLAFGQGSLTPPGPPAPTFKTLQQVEPRTPISSLPYVITQPGSYYVTTNLTGNPGGITISNSNVTLDLMGFELVGGTGDGIVVSGSHTNICIRNGTVRNWGANGVNASSAVNGLYQHLQVSGNAFVGLYVDNGVVVNCSAYRNSTGGFVFSASTVSGCTAARNSGDGIAASESKVSDCTVILNSGDGIEASGGRISNCNVSLNDQNGINVDFDSTVAGCTSRLNGFDGIRMGSKCRVTDNNCSDNGTAGLFSGIFANGDGNRIEGNHVIGNDAGISTTGQGNLIIRNSAKANTTNNYVIGANNRYGPIINITAAGAAAYSGSGPAASTVATTDPWANFSH